MQYISKICQNNDKFLRRKAKTPLDIGHKNIYHRDLRTKSTFLERKKNLSRRQQHTKLLQ